MRGEKLESDRFQRRVDRLDGNRSRRLPDEFKGFFTPDEAEEYFRLNATPMKTVIWRGPGPCPVNPPSQMDMFIKKMRQKYPMLPLSADEKMFLSARSCACTPPSDDEPRVKCPHCLAKRNVPAVEETWHDDESA